MLRRLARSPVAYWVAAVTLAALTGLVVHGSVTAAAEARDRWGVIREVAVVARPVATGATIGEGDLVLRPRPAGAVPDEALTDTAVGRVATADLYPGEVAVTGRIAPEGLRGVAALLTDGTRALAVPSGPATPVLAVGDVVDVLVSLDPLAGQPPYLAAPAATVVAVGEGSATVSVPASQAPEVAHGLTVGNVTLALRPP